MTDNTLPHIVIVGGGAGGLELATSLGKKWGKQHKAIITLVDASPVHLWKPLLHEVAAGTLNSYEDELNYLAFASENYFQFCLGQFQAIDRTQKEIMLAPIYDEFQQVFMPLRKLKYTILVIAVGSLSNDFNIPGVREECLFLDTTAQAKYFHDYLLKMMMRLSYDQQANKKDFTIAIVGGGATGIELAAELHYAIRQMKSYGFAFDPTLVKLKILDSAPKLLAMLPAHLSIAAKRNLEQLEIEVHTDERVTQVLPDGIVTAKGFVPTSMTIWAAGIKAPDFLKKLDGLETNNINQLLVKQTLQTTIDDSIFAMGDCAYCLQSDSLKPVPPRAQAAHQQASFLAKAIPNYLVQNPLPLYHYQDYGSLISISNYETIGTLMSRVAKSLPIEGKLARLTYLSLYKMHQIALYGAWRVGMLMLANAITRRIRPRLKLH